MKKNIDRREFLKDAVAGAVGVTAAGALVGCSPQVQAPAEAATASFEIAAKAGSSDLSALLAASSAEEGEITDAADGGEYDIIVIGAGASGVPCAVKAFQDGANVLVLQKEAGPLAQGGSACGIILDESDPSAVLNFIEDTEINCAYRADWEQLKVYTENSGEAVQWYSEELAATGYTSFTADPGVVNYGEDFGSMTTLTVRVIKPDNVGTSMTQIMGAYEDQLDIRYSTPAVQLIKEGNKVVGVYAKDDDGNYYKFTAIKGVVLATGDYQNNDAMVDKYCPDVKNFDKKQYNKTGDGHLMAMMAGAVLEPVAHTKMLHDFDSGPMWDEPFLRVDMSGKRFHNEVIELSLVNNYMRDYPAGEAGKYCQIFDSNYVEQVTEWGGRPTDEETIQKYMPEVEMERVGVIERLIATFKADTLEELAEKLKLPADELKASVERYNELVEQGFDADFGKNPKYMKKIEKAPFWGIHKNVRVSALTSGVYINSKFEALDAEHNVIENLYAVGNSSGPFYGGIDYPLHVPGLSLGRCVTGGYTVGKMLAAK